MPGKTFHCRRGVSHGDPFSPLLFAITADILQVIINDGAQRGLLNRSIPLQYTSDFPILHYANDTFIILEGCSTQLSTLKDLLNSFSLATGLKVNFGKSMLVPINMTEENTEQLASEFRCTVGSFLFTYLGLPLGLSKPKVADFLPLVTRCERRLASTSTLLSLTGRLQLTNSVFSALPTFYMCTFKLHKTVIKQVDKYRKHCLWRGTDLIAKSSPKSAWEIVCIPKKEGGLGVINLRVQNEALLLKNLHKFYNRLDIPWVHLIWEKLYSNGNLPRWRRKGSFWWRDILKLLDQFKGLAVVSIKDGKTCSFWHDLWGGRIPAHSYQSSFLLPKTQQ